MQKVILTSFGSFPGVDLNPTVELVNSLLSYFEKNLSDLYEFSSIELPVSFEDSFKFLEKQISEIKPNFVFSFGVAVNREKISLETQAQNLILSKKPDALGNSYFEKKVCERGADFLISDFNWEDSFERLGLGNSDLVELSSSAGNYVCNAHFYSLLDARSRYSYKGSFIHIPRFECVSLEKQVDIIGKLIENTLKS
jgi:pyrrolidone-carboxylate peptidase